MNKAFKKAPFTVKFGGFNLDLKRIGNKLLHPPGWLLAVLSIISAMMLTVVFVKDISKTLIAYAVYALASYRLLVDCIFIAIVLPKHYNKIKQMIYDNKYGNRYMTDAAFKVEVSLYISLAITLGFSVYNLVSGFTYSSLWLGAVAVYYILLSIIRFLLLRFIKKNNGKQDMIAEYRSYRLSAILMMLITFTLSGIVLSMILKNKSYVYSDVYVITSATYTFYTLTVSIIDIIRYRKYESPVLSAAKAIRLAAALISILSLETVMLIHFGNDEVLRRNITALTGAAVSIILILMSIYMIVHANKEIKKLKEQ